jgi:hypothetical protein
LAVRTVLLVHIVAGALGIVSGTVALFAAKGANLHRKSGMLFVFSMVAMAITASVVAVSVGRSVLEGLLPAYFVITGLTTVRPPSAGARRLDIGAMAVALGVGLANLAFGFDLLASGVRVVNGVPVPMIVFLGAVALLSALGDARQIRSGGLRGARRIARHLWRLCFALWIATGSFFLGQADKVPASLRHMALLMPLAMAPLFVMAYWLWHVRFKKTFRDRTAVGPQQVRSNEEPPRAVA